MGRAACRVLRKIFQFRGLASSSEPRCAIQLRFSALQCTAVSGHAFWKLVASLVFMRKRCCARRPQKACWSRMRRIFSKEKTDDLSCLGGLTRGLCLCFQHVATDPEGTSISLCSLNISSIYLVGITLFTCLLGD